MSLSRSGFLAFFLAFFFASWEFDGFLALSFASREFGTSKTGSEKFEIENLKDFHAKLTLV